MSGVFFSPSLLPILLNTLVLNYIGLLYIQGTPALSQSGIAADALLKGTITRLATEDSSPEKCREEASAKGHVIYEGKSGHILSYDSEYLYILPDQSQDCSRFYFYNP